MDDNPITRLTEGQKACLRLTLRAMTSKEIARELDISPHTVDHRLKSAIQLLGAANRVDAARRLEAFEKALPDIGNQVPSVADRMKPSTFSGSEWSSSEVRHAEVHEEQLPFLFPPGKQSEGWLPFATKRSPSNDLSTLSRSLWVVGLSLIWIVAISFGAYALTTLNQLYPAPVSKVSTH